jgi:predicted metal-binding protein
MAGGELLQRFTPPAIRVVQYSKEEARRFRGGSVGTEHILLGLIREQEGIGARVLERLGVSLGRAQNEIRRQGNQEARAAGGSRSWSPAARRVLEHALDEARELNPRLGLPNFVDTEHLLLGLVREADGMAVRVLKALGVEADGVRSEVIRVLGGEHLSEETEPEASGENWVERAKGLGAAEAKLIGTGSVITAPWVRLKCQYGCGGYGRCLTCPPYSPTPEETRAVLDCYRTALLVHCPGGGKWRSIREIAADLEREIFLAGHYKALAFGSGPCNLCEECNLEHCLHPSQARPSMEAAGIDVYATARTNGFPIDVVTDHECPQNYYGLVLIE